jgi:hypothetical protein
MELLRRLQIWLWPTKGQTSVLDDLYEQLKVADGYLRAQRYDQAREVLLNAANRRGLISDPRAILYINNRSLRPG